MSLSSEDTTEIRGLLYRDRQTKVALRFLKRINVSLEAIRRNLARAEEALADEPLSSNVRLLAGKFLLAEEDIPLEDLGILTKTPNLASIIILNYNTLKITSDCIKSVLALTEYPAEMIVVDNGSTDGSVAWLKKQNYLTLISNKNNRGWTAANNQGIRVSKGAYCLLLNSDTIVRTRGWLKAMIRLAQPPDVATVGAKLLYQDGTIQHIGGSIHDVNPFHPFDGAPADIPESLKVREVPFNTGACLLIKKSVIERVGLLDEKYVFGYGDVDYGLRCLEAGFRNLYCPSSILTHLWAYTQRKTGKWIPSESFARYKQKWTDKTPALSKKVDMDFRWPDSAQYIRRTGPGSHIATIRKKESAMTWGALNENQ